MNKEKREKIADGLWKAKDWKILADEERKKKKKPKKD